MDHLNTIQLSMDMSDLRGLLSVIRATQSALRERIPMIHDWYTLQRGWATQSRRGGDGAWARPPAAALLTLGRHRQALELQLRTALDLFGAAQKQKRQQLREPWTGAEHGARSHSPQRSPDGAEDEGRPSQQGGGGGVRRRAEESNNAIARTIRLFINKAAWHMLENDGQPMCDVILRWASLRAVTMSDQATHLVSEVHLLYVINRQPDPMFTDLVGPYVRPRDPVPDFCVQKMLRVQWSELAPVGGITIVERFEVDLHPLRLQLSYDIAQKLVNYLYPPQDASAAAAADAATGPPRAPSRRQRRPTEASFAPDDAEPATATGASASSISGTPLDDSASAHSPSASGAASPRSFTPARPTAAGGSGRSLLAARMRQRAAVPPSAPAEGRRASSEGPLLGLAAGDLPQPLQHSVSGLMPGATGHTGPTPLLPESGSMMNLPQGGDNRDQIDEMKKRASSNKTFLNVKIGGSTLCISYQGRRANNITDLRDFEFRAPTLELRNEVESYFELLMQVKREYRSVVVQHTGALVKEKLRQLHNRKAWSKTSSGPDWAARRLLISMDRRIDQERQANLSVALHDAAAAAAATPVSPLPPPPPHVPAPTAPSSQASSAASAASSPPPTTKGAKPPSSKYMILDPRKLMGKRLPSMLPRSLPPLGFGRSEPPSPRPRQEDSGGRAMSCEPSGAAAPDSAAPASATQGLRALYSAMHIDMFPAASATG
ncbi:Protein SABRE, partial [Coemansia helicoidea]